MLDCMGFKDALQSCQLHQPGSNWGYAPEQLIEQMIASSCAWLFDKLRLNPVTLDVDSTVLNWTPARKDCFAPTAGFTTRP